MMSDSATSPSCAAPLVSVDIPPPDLSPYIAGNTGIMGFTSLESGRHGPHVVLISLIHGNEYLGAAALADLLASDFRPLCGKLTVGFANLAAFSRFDLHNPTASRYVEEDMNRLWDDFALFGMRHSVELDRAREIRPIIESADILLDLHSMFWPSTPLLLCGTSAKARMLGLSVGTPDLVVADAGHLSGKRLIDYGHFTENGAKNATALLLEAGTHWNLKTVLQIKRTIYALLRQVGMYDMPSTSAKTPCFAEVVKTITARTNRFQFVHDFHGGEMIAKAGTLIAHDGDEEIHTPEDGLIMVMPNLKVGHGHTAVRLAKIRDL